MQHTQKAPIPVPYKIAVMALGISFTAAFAQLQLQAADQSEKKRPPAACKNCKLAQAKKGSPDRDGTQPRPERAKKNVEHKKAASKGRPEHPPGHRPPVPPRFPDAHSPRGLPPEARKFSERIRGFHQEIGKLYREGKQDSAREATNDLRNFIQEHAALARRLGAEFHRPEPGRGSDRGSAPASGSGPKPGHGPRSGDHLDRSPHHRPPPPEADTAEHRIHHLHQAAENLEQAGMQEESKKIHQHAENMERQLHQERQRNEGRAQAERVERLESEIRELRKMMSRLKKENEELKAKIHKKGKR